MTSACRAFPFFAPKLDGTSYYRRPDTYEVVFDRVPSYAKGFEKLFNDIGDPLAWEKDQNIALDGVRVVDGRQTIVLRLTKKIHSTILDHTLAYVDARELRADAHGMVLHERRQDFDVAAVRQARHVLGAARRNTRPSTFRTCTRSPTLSTARTKPTSRSIRRSGAP